ncbi:MAG: 1-acyl-sn-glycerol-3-phosphate acyltransferase [Candidatus Schekmanbacteria bacterium]|nr:1-acyl-sn-glycerol-3-phosphate acyltransferase [Candidatus Schekmanbacteria bacterium]
MRLPTRILSAIWLNITALVAFVFFRVLNHVEVQGREHIPSRNRVIVLANHVSMIDSFAIGVAAYYPRAMVRPSLFPWHPAALENFFQGRLLAVLSTLWRCIPVRRGERDFGALTAMTERLQEGTMLLFPEGTRTRSGRLGMGRPGVGKLLHDVQPIVIPAAHTGMEEILPVGARFPRIGKRARIAFGAPIDLSEYYELPAGKDTSQLIVNRVMAEIAVLRGALLTPSGAGSGATAPHAAASPVATSLTATVRGARRNAPLTLPTSPAKEYPNTESAAPNLSGSPNHGIAGRSSDR